MDARFQWDLDKECENQRKHGIGFVFAKLAFSDPARVIARDLAHSKSEDRFYCFGAVTGQVVTVRFTYRNDVIRIIGAGHWRKGKRIYERANQILR